MSTPRKYGTEEILTLIGGRGRGREAFWQRADIIHLAETEKEHRWAIHQEKMDSFLAFISGMESFVVPKKDT